MMTMTSTMTMTMMLRFDEVLSCQASYSYSQHYQQTQQKETGLVLNVNKMVYRCGVHRDGDNDNSCCLLSLFIELQSLSSWTSDVGRDRSLQVDYIQFSCEAMGKPYVWATIGSWAATVG